MYHNDTWNNEFTNCDLLINANPQCLFVNRGEEKLYGFISLMEKICRSCDTRMVWITGTGGGNIDIASDRRLWLRRYDLLCRLRAIEIFGSSNLKHWSDTHCSVVDLNCGDILEHPFIDGSVNNFDVGSEAVNCCLYPDEEKQFIIGETRCDLVNSHPDFRPEFNRHPQIPYRTWIDGF